MNRGATCPICKSDATTEVYDFGQQPFTTEFLNSNNDEFHTSHLSLRGCDACSFVYIPEPADPELLYGNDYGLTSQCPATHLDDLVDELLSQLKNKDSFIVEVAANDGAFLKRFQGHGFQKCLGIEPAENCVKAGAKLGVSILNDFFNLESAQKIVEHNGKANLLIIRHALEHIDDLEGLLKAIDVLLADDGLLYIEIPDSVEVFKRGKYMFFFEQHVNYFTPFALNKYLSASGLGLQKDYFFSYGGGAAGFLYSRSKEKVKIEFKSELLDGLSERIKSEIHRVKDLVRGDSTAKLSLYGAGFVGFSVINNAGIADKVCAVFDDNLNKIGRFVPGINNAIPILTGDELLTISPEVCLMSPLSSKELEQKIINKHDEYVQAGGRFIEF